mgnify:CR=1 FL=1
MSQFQIEFNRAINASIYISVVGLAGWLGEYLVTPKNQSKDGKDLKFSKAAFKCLQISAAAYASITFLSLPFFKKSPTKISGLKVLGSAFAITPFVHFFAPKSTAGDLCGQICESALIPGSRGLCFVPLYLKLKSSIHGSASL